MKYYVLICCFLTLVSFRNYEPPKQKNFVIELKAAVPDDDVIDQLKVTYRYNSKDDGKNYNAEIIVVSYKSEKEFAKKVFNYVIVASNKPRNLRKDDIIASVMYTFYLTKEKYSNYSNIEKFLNDVFTNLEEDIAFDIKRIEVAGKVKDIEIPSDQ